MERTWRGEGLMKGFGALEQRGQIGLGRIPRFSRMNDAKVAGFSGFDDFAIGS